MCGKIPSTVESLLTDTPNKGHCIKYLSTMDKTKSPNFNPPINSNLLTEDSLYTVDKPLEFILVPKCPLFGVSTVIGKGLPEVISKFENNKVSVGFRKCTKEIVCVKKE